MNEVDGVVSAAVVSIQVARCNLFDKALGTVVVALIVDQIPEPAAVHEMQETYVVALNLVVFPTLKTSSSKGQSMRLGRLTTFAIGPKL